MKEILCQLTFCRNFYSLAILKKLFFVKEVLDHHLKAYTSKYLKSYMRGREDDTTLFIVSVVTLRSNSILVDNKDKAFPKLHFFTHEYITKLDLRPPSWGPS